MIKNQNGFILPDRSNISSYRKVLSAAKEGEIIRLRNGLYANPDVLKKDVVDIEAIVPGGILCLYSAWYHYNLTTQIPDAFYVAVSRNRKLRLPGFPHIKPIYQSPELLEIGKTEITVHDIKLMITDLERTVCDAVKYRNKIGIDVMNEIINNYLHDSTRDISKLTDYAKRLRIYATLHQILQIKL